MNDSIAADIAAIIASFGSAMLFFRIERELQMSQKREVIWIPWADRLLIAGTLVSLLLVIFPIVAFTSRPSFLANLPMAGCAATSIMVAGYIFGILAHYRLIFGKDRQGQRDNPEPAERWIVILAAGLAMVAFCSILFGVS